MYFKGNYIIYKLLHIHLLNWVVCYFLGIPYFGHYFAALALDDLEQEYLALEYGIL